MTGQEKFTAKNTWVINLFGGPGSGKTTMAFELCHMIKQHGLEVYFSSEVAKYFALQNMKITSDIQTGIIVEQMQQEQYYYGLVDFIVTDAPLEINTFYGNLREDPSNYIAERQIREHREFYSNDREYSQMVSILDLQLIRSTTRVFKQEGRYQNEQEALLCDNKIPEYLREVHEVNAIPFTRESMLTYVEYFIKKKKNGHKIDPYRPGKLD